MVESTVNMNFYKRVLLEELIEEVKGMKPKWEGNNTWAEICAYIKVLKVLEDRLRGIKEDTDE